jgi:hypothetical protein
MRWVDVHLRAFLSRPLDGGKWSLSRLGHFTAGEGSPSTNLIGGRVRPIATLHVLEKRTASFICWELNSDTKGCVIAAESYPCLAGLCFWNWLRVQTGAGF